MTKYVPTGGDEYRRLKATGWKESHRDLIRPDEWFSRMEAPRRRRGDAIIVSVPAAVLVGEQISAPSAESIRRILNNRREWHIMYCGRPFIGSGPI